MIYGLSICSFLGCQSTPPTVSDIILIPNPNQNTPLVATLTFSTDKPARVTLKISDGKGSWSVLPGSEYKTDHSLMVLGLQPNTTHSITVSVIDDDENESVSEPLELTTDSLPENFPPLEVKTSQPEKMESGVTLFNLIRYTEDGLDRNYGLLLAVDAEGNVVWYYRADHGIGDARRLSNGNILYLYRRSSTAERIEGESGVAEIDMLGNIVQQWHPTGISRQVPKGSIPVNVDTFHHEIHEMPSGDFLVLSTEVRTYENYPSSATDPQGTRGPANVVGDVVTEFSNDGSVIHQWTLLDIVDPYRIGYGSIDSTFWNDTYADVVHSSVKDWAHANAVIYDARDNSFLVSLRHQDAVIKVNLETGDLVWILGNHDGWKPPWSSYLLSPRGELEWQFHQHTPMITPNGNIL